MVNTSYHLSVLPNPCLIPACFIVVVLFITIFLTAVKYVEIATVIQLLICLFSVDILILQQEMNGHTDEYVEHKTRHN